MQGDPVVTRTMIYWSSSFPTNFSIYKHTITITTVTKILEPLQMSICACYRLLCPISSDGETVVVMSTGAVMEVPSLHDAQDLAALYQQQAYEALTRRQFDHAFDQYLMLVKLQPSSKAGQQSNKKTSYQNCS